MKINCQDADEPGNVNSQIKYEIVGQQPEGQQMFTIGSDGVVRVSNPNLDREVSLRSLHLSILCPSVYSGEYTGKYYATD